MNESLSYILAASLTELFPAVEITQIAATSKCFFCDLLFPGEFSTEIMRLLEERMRQWVGKKLPFNTLTMMPLNAAQMLEHHGDAKLAKKVKYREGEVSLLQLNRFFFEIEGRAPKSTDDVPYFKLVCFWPLKKGIRLLGVGASSKEALKEQAQTLKTLKNPQKILEEYGFVSWIEDNLIWETRAEKLKAGIKKKILEIYEAFDEVTLPEQDEKGQQKLLLEWVRARKRGGVEFQKKKLNPSCSEPWDPSNCLYDHGWGASSINSYLHLITKFLTIFTFDYEIVSVGKIDANLEKVLKDLRLTWTSYRGPNRDRSSRLEFQVRDRLGRSWTMSTLEWDRKEELVQVTLCASFERCIALLADLNSETLLNRLQQLEN